jgi:membrane protein DedA with SNARE-associated domain/rhodanese-related sulfurtransferase
MAFVAHWGLWLTFATVFLDQLGIPSFAATILIAAGAVADESSLRPEAVLAVAVAACLSADHLWFVLGRRYGRRLLGGICKLSLSPDTCVRQADDLIARYGAPLLLVAKFIPGVSAVTIPTVAAMGVSYGRFLVFDIGGSAIWCGTYIAIGMIFGREIDKVIVFMGHFGGRAFIAVAFVFGLYIAFKLLHRRRLQRLYHLVRISPAEMRELMANEPRLVVLDARSSLARAEDPRVLPRSIFVDFESALEALPGDARDGIVVTFCTCPNEASAALLAERLLKDGYDRVRVLVGGTEALALLGTA